MDILSSDDLIALVKLQLSSLSTLISDPDGYEFVCNRAVQELGWKYPITNPTQLFWLVNRATRHAIYILLIASANKFKYKQVNLQNRFEHFKSLIDTMDKEFEVALDSNIALFAGVEPWKMFGTKVDAGFAYDSVGNDITYDVSQYVQASSQED